MLGLNGYSGSVYVGCLVERGRVATVGTATGARVRAAEPALLAPSVDTGGS